MKPVNAQKRRSWIATVGFVCLSVVAVTAQCHNQLFEPINRALFRVTSPIHDLISSQAMGVQAIWSELSSLRKVHGENERLRAENDRLSLLNVRIERLVREKNRLARLLDLADQRKDLRLSVAHVRHRSNSPYFRTLGIQIDQLGAEVEPGMPVLSAGGLVGQLSRVESKRAEILLLTDPRTAVDVVLEKSRIRGIAVGNGDPREHSMTLKYLDKTVPLIDGERVLTTGDDGRFPSDILVGQVRVGRAANSGPFQDAIVRPAARLDDLRLVYIILGTTGLIRDGSEFIKGRK